MPYHFVRRAGVLALAATMVVPQAGALSDVSSWAQEDIAAAQQAGLMPTSLADSAAREEITRAEFCAIAVKAYKQLTGKAVYASGQKFFRDTDDANVNTAYSLGLVTGRASGYFDPNASIERQDLCVILNNILDKAGIDAPEIAGDACVEDYDDVSTIKSYAVDPVVRMVDYTIVNGISDGLGSAQLAPSAPRRASRPLSWPTVSAASSKSSRRTSPRSLSPSRTRRSARRTTSGTPRARSFRTIR